MYYTVKYRKVTGYRLLGLDRSDADTETITSETPDALIVGLDAYQLYEFQVRAHTESAEGPYTDKVQCSTKQGKPSPPSHVEYTLVAPGAVELRWKEPSYKNGIIVSYIVRYSNNFADPDSKWFSKRENGTVTYSTIYDLDVDAIYYFKVGAETVAGEGKPTRILMVRTQPIALPPSHPPTAAPQSGSHEMGIIVGVSIGGACIIISILIILLRNRCFPVRPPPEAPVARRCNGNGYIPHRPNGTLGTVRLSSEFHEMDSMQPLTRLSESDHVDTKGGYDYIVSPDRNGVLVGAPVNGLSVTYQPNGQVTTFIAKSPHYPGNLSAYQPHVDVNPKVPLRTTSLQQGHPMKREEMMPLYPAGSVLSGCDDVTPGQQRVFSSLEDIDHSEHSGTTGSRGSQSGASHSGTTGSRGSQQGSTLGSRGEHWQPASPLQPTGPAPIYTSTPARGRLPPRDPRATRGGHHQASIGGHPQLPGGDSNYPPGSYPMPAPEVTLNPSLPAPYNRHYPTTVNYPNFPQTGGNTRDNTVSPSSQHQPGEAAAHHEQQRPATHSSHPSQEQQQSTTSEAAEAINSSQPHHIREPGHSGHHHNTVHGAPVSSFTSQSGSQGHVNERQRSIGDPNGPGVTTHQPPNTVDDHAIDQVTYKGSSSNSRNTNSVNNRTANPSLTSDITSRGSHHDNGQVLTHA